ncbi:hypothetical protein LOTGIDRAFT_228264 [Lottia gigantea]|uniref:Chitinase n=1 Tax=Lottia gigantea TaxID=225164 RepID=V4ARZ6_LOTGI|nr:hypothetical protein LOTGIDRAFT_228264 [Lottia gigantea]ESO97635.1 hypothetical protein LOTGIDRAFT_228264 [Lottia gigantea]
MVCKLFLAFLLALTVSVYSDEHQNVQYVAPISSYTECKSLLDVVVVVDGSDSIAADDFVTLKLALESLVLDLNVRPDNTRFGVVLYSSTIAGKIDISGNAGHIIPGIRALPHPRDGTNTALAIAEMNDMVAAQRRPGVPVVGVVITDGISKDQAATAQQAAIARNQGINMFAIGVGINVDTTELKSIASNDQQVLTTVNFNQLGSLLSNFIQVVCPTTTTSTTTTTTTTTTPAPTTSTTVPTTTTTVKPDPCANCKMSNGIGFNPHPTDCDKYFQCEFSLEGLVNSVLRQCGQGLFWDQDLLTCNYPAAVQCRADPCQNYHISSYKKAGNCREYYSCSNGTSMPECCKKGFAYVSGQCVPSYNCNAHCKGDFINPYCEMRAVSDDISSYEQFVRGVGWVRKPCAPGSAFSPVECSCTVAIDPLPINAGECKAEVYIPFDDDVAIDKSGNGNYVENEGVFVIGGKGYFNGTSGLRIPRFSNIEFGSKVVITMRYKAESIYGSQGLISNGDCGKPGSLLVAIDNTNTLFGLQTVSGTAGIVTIPSANGWNEIIYQVEGDVLTGSVNGNSAHKTIDGAVKRSQCALQVGRATHLSNFRGYVDELTVYLC